MKGKVLPVMAAWLEHSKTKTINNNRARYHPDIQCIFCDFCDYCDWTQMVGIFYESDLHVVCSSNRVKLLRPVSQCRWRRTLPGVRSPAPHGIWWDKVVTNCKFLGLVTPAVSNLQNHKHFCHWTHTLRSRLAHVDDENLLSGSFRRMSFSFSGSWWCIIFTIISLQIFIKTHKCSTSTSSHCQFAQKTHRQHEFTKSSATEKINTSFACTMLCLGEELLSQEEVTCVAVHLTKRIIKTPKLVENQGNKSSKRT